MAVGCKLLLLMFLLFTSGNCFRNEERCVALPFDLCKDLNYNATLLPNVKMNVETITDAIRLIREFSPLFNIGCYENLKYFICNVYAPTCHVINNNPTPVYPCQHVCTEAREKCEPIMLKHGATWPDSLLCEKLRPKGPSVLCGSPPVIKTSKTIPTVKKQAGFINWIEAILKFDNGVDKFVKLIKSKGWPTLSNNFGVAPNTEINFEQLCKHSTKHVYLIKNRKELCKQKCHANHIFTAADKKFATVWLSVWSVIGFFSTFVTITTFLIDHKRFKYPERPIIFLSFCYNLYSIGYLIRVFGGYDTVICETSKGINHMAIDGMSVTSCTLVFFFLYYFGMSSAIWWVILSFTWFLSAARKWGHESIEKYSSIFHGVAWMVPTVQTIITLVTKRVDIDRLSGLCFVGNSNSSDLLIFVIIPLLVYLILGTVFLGLGFVSLVKIRKVLRKERNTNKLERLIVRIGVFSVLYSVPASIVVGCFIQEYNRVRNIEKQSDDILGCLSKPGCLSTFNPRVELFYLRYFMLLVVGVTSGVWIWTTKTLKSWRKFTGLKRENKKQKRDSSLHEAHRLFEANCDTGNQSLKGSNHNMSYPQVYRPLQQTQFVYPVQNHASYMQSNKINLEPVFRSPLSSTSDKIYNYIDQQQSYVEENIKYNSRNNSRSVSSTDDSRIRNAMLLRSNSKSNYSSERI